MSTDATSGPPNRPRSTPIPDPDGNQGPLLPPPTAAQFLSGQSGLPWTPQPGPDVNRVFQGGSAGYVPPASGPRPGGSSVARVVAVMILLVAVGGVGAAVYLGTRSGDSVTQPTISTVLPDGATPLYADGAARAVADQLELAIAGDPTGFTVIYLFPDYAVATADDPERPGHLIGAYWRDGAIGDADITSSDGGGDLSALRFTEGEVDWEAIVALVPQAAGLLDLADGQVTYVSVQRSGAGNPPPIVIDVFVDGPSGGGHVEASASGDILSVNNG